MRSPITQRWDFSDVGLGRVVLITVVGTLFGMGMALGMVSYTTQFMDETSRDLTFKTAFVAPIIMSVPVVFYFASKLRELAIAHRALARVAATDSLTTCLNRGAFITLVDAYLTQVNSLHPVRGCLLIVDADHFKAVNDNFGHSSGDDALKIIANTIKEVVRASDVVGRVGGEEFAVFLPQADVGRMAQIAERIRAGVEAATFHPNGRPLTLSVSVGGAEFEHAVPFKALFEVADQRLYEAKRKGRNRAEVGTMWLGPAEYSDNDDDDRGESVSSTG